MKHKIYLPLLIGAFSSPNLLASDSLASSTKGSASGPQESEKKIGLSTIVKVHKMISKAMGFDEEVAKKLVTGLFKFVNDPKMMAASSSDYENQLNQIYSKAKKSYMKSRTDAGDYGSGSAQIEYDFAAAWKTAINSIHTVEAELPNTSTSEEKNSYFDDGSEDSQDVPSKTMKLDTTLINILLRAKDCTDKASKLHALIQFGADKNLHNHFKQDSNIQNQTEYPIRIALTSIEDAKVRYDVLEVLLDDLIIFNGNDLLNEKPSEGESSKGLAYVRNYPIAESIIPNKDYLLSILLPEPSPDIKDPSRKEFGKRFNDFVAFNMLLRYLEDHKTFIVENFDDQISGVKDQIKCPILEIALRQMMLIRNKTYTQGETPDIRYDNIQDFFTQKKLAKQIKQHGESQFNLYFQQALKINYDPLFKKMGEKIEEVRKQSGNRHDILGEDFKKYVMQWTQWANFRNRIALHLNKFAITAANNTNRSNVIKLIRYTNIYDKSHEARTDDEKTFRELHVLNGADLIYLTPHKYKWTPLMYAMIRKEIDGLQLYLRQAPHEVTNIDGVDNNILHLAFPLPGLLEEKAEQNTSDNPLDLIGANISNPGVKEKTSDAIRAILTERSIDRKELVEALTHLSASNFTPVSLAAAMGYHDIYQYIVDFLKLEGSWNPDDHAHLGCPIEEILVKGIENYIKLKQTQEEKIPGSFPKSEQADLTAALAKAKADFSAVNANAIRTIYHPEDKSSLSLLQAIWGPAEKILKASDNAKQTDGRGPKNVNQAALEAAMLELSEPKQVKKIVSEANPAYQKYLNDQANYSFFTPKSSDPVPAERINKEVFEPAKHAGLAIATSAVKGSYLKQVVTRILRDYYLEGNKASGKLKFEAVYQAITGRKSLNFFESRLNKTIEKRMQLAIKEELKANGRLLEEEDEDTSTNRMDQIENRLSGEEDAETNPAKKDSSSFTL